MIVGLSNKYRKLKKLLEKRKNDSDIAAERVYQIFNKKVKVKNIKTEEPTQKKEPQWENHEYEEIQKGFKILNPIESEQNKQDTTLDSLSEDSKLIALARALDEKLEKELS